MTIASVTRSERQPARGQMTADQLLAASPTPDKDHVAEIQAALRAINTLDIDLAKLERQADGIYHRLHDATLLRQIPAGDHRRTDAEDRLHELEASISRHERSLQYLITDVATHGAFLTTTELQAIALAVPHEVIERVHHTEPETKRIAVWQAIDAGHCPF